MPIFDYYPSRPTCDFLTNLEDEDLDKLNEAVTAFFNVLIPTKLEDESPFKDFFDNIAPGVAIDRLSQLIEWEYGYRKDGYHPQDWEIDPQDITPYD